MVSKLVSSYELEDSELNASLCESWQERLSAYDKKENPLLQYCDLFFISAPFLLRESSSPIPPKNKKHPFGCFSLLKVVTDFDTKMHMVSTFN